MSSGDPYLGHVRRGRGQRPAGLALEGITKGEWLVSVVAPGCKPVTKSFIVSERVTWVFDLEALPGRYVRSEFDTTLYWVEVRQVGATAPWKRILWKDGRVRISHTPTPGTFQAFLSPGRYEVRMQSDFWLEELLEVEITEQGPEMVWTFPKRDGASFSGTARTSEGTPFGQGVHYLFLREGALGGSPTWRRLPTKDLRLYAQDSTFTCRGLAPGGYRVTFDETGRQLIPEFELLAGEQTIDLIVER